jgi:hypothetical protein
MITALPCKAGNGYGLAGLDKVNYLIELGPLGSVLSLSVRLPSTMCSLCMYSTVAFIRYYAMSCGPIKKANRMPSTQLLSVQAKVDGNSGKQPPFRPLVSDVFPVFHIPKLPLNVPTRYTSGWSPFY